MNAEPNLHAEAISALEITNDKLREQLQGLFGEGVISEVAKERAAQIVKWPADHDDLHIDGGIASNAVRLATTGLYQAHDIDRQIIERDWGLAGKWDRRRSLVVAAALLIAEVERIDRLEALEDSRN